MKSFYQSDEDLTLEIAQLEHELSALEISIKRKRLQLSERQSEQPPKTPTRVSIGQEDRYNKELHIEDRVKVLTSSKNKSFIAGVTEATITGLTPQKQVQISSIENNKIKTWREAQNLQRLDHDE